MQIDIIYQDEDIIICNKPAGLLVIPDRFNMNLPSLGRALEAKLGQKIWIVHRIDKDTSGAICFAKNEEAHKYMSQLFQDHLVTKTYIGLVTGRIIEPEARIESAIIEHPAIGGKMIIAKKGKPSITDYKVLEQWSLFTLVQFRILTGRTHQIRVHMQSIGHPLMCDELYGDGKPFLLSSIKKRFKLSENEEAERPLLSRLALHASQLDFVKPDGSAISVEAPLPKDMSATIKQLNKWAGPVAEQKW